MDLSAGQHALAALAASAAGFINAVAGGGTLVSFPTLLGIGVPSVRANVTNAVALCPGYFGGTYAQRTDLAAQRNRARAMVLPAATGGLIGSVLLIVSPEKVFHSLVPFLILGACLLLGFQDQIKRRLPTRTVIATTDATTRARPLSFGVIASVFFASIYGGYFGAGLSIIVIAVLGLMLNDSSANLNALKQLIAAAANIFAAIFFSFSGKVVWSLVLVMAPASLLGGQIGGRVVRKIPAKPLRAVVIAFGIAVAVKQWL